MVEISGIEPPAGIRRPAAPLTYSYLQELSGSFSYFVKKTEPASADSVFLVEISGIEPLTS